MKIRLEKFTGMIPRRHARLLPDTASELAENTKLWSGKIKPWRGNDIVCDPFQTLPRSIYLFAKNDLPPGFWFQFSESEVDVVKGQVGGDTTERTYFTGGPQGQPQITDKFIGIRGEEETWQADQHYAVGNIVVGTSTSGVYFECTTPGTAGSSEPSWDQTPPNTTADDTVVWTARTLTPSTQCDDLPDQSVNLGVPAPINAPSAQRKKISGNIIGFESQNSLRQTLSGKLEVNRQAFEIEADGTAQQLNVSVTVRISTSLSISNATIEFFLWRNTATVNPVDSELVLQVNFQSVKQSDPDQNDPGIITHGVKLSENVVLSAGPHVYSVSRKLTNFDIIPIQDASSMSFNFTYGADVTGGAGVMIDLGNVGQVHPFEVGDQIRIEGVVGAVDSNFEQVNGIHEVVEVGGQKVGIPLTELDAADYVSGGTWEFVPNDLNTFSRFYVYTYIARMGTLLQEGPPSPVSTVLGLGNDSAVSLTSLTPPPAGFNISRIRIYRTVLGNDTAEFKFVAEIGAINTTFDDTFREGSTNLGEVLLSEDWGPPPADLHSIVQMPNGIMVGLSKNEVFVSEPFQPHSWPDEFRQSMNFNGVSTGVYGNTVLITTNGNPYILTGNEPGDMTMDKLELSQSCVSKRSTVDMGYSVLYASPDGIVQVGPSIARLVTDPLFTKDEWGKLNPSSMIAARWDDRYVAFFTKTNGDRGGFVFDPKNPEASYTELNIIAEAAYTEPNDARLYLVDAANDIVEFDADQAEDLEFTWLSKRFHLPRPVNFGAAIVHAEAYPVGFSLFSIEKDLSDGSEDQRVERHTRSVLDNKPFRLPAGYTADEIQIELRGNTVIEGVYVAETLRELNLV